MGGKSLKGLVFASKVFFFFLTNKVKNDSKVLSN